MATFSLLDADPDLGEDLNPERFALARRAVTARVLSYGPGPWNSNAGDFDGTTSLGLLLIDGVMMRAVTVGDYTGAELLGPGDVTQPWLRATPDASVGTDVDFEVVEAMRVAVLDRSFILASVRWPELAAAVSRRIMQRTHWLAFHLAVCGLRRVDDRLLLVLWHFADRWGHVTRDGVRLDIRLTHDVLAAVIGARRPSVTTAIKRLVEQNQVKSGPRSSWLLVGSPPVELRELRGQSARLSA